MPELSKDTKLVLYFLLQDALKEGGELEKTFQLLLNDEVNNPLGPFEGTPEEWAQVQREVALFSEWCRETQR